MSDPERPITRLAPSPTGALHLGNARTFLINWLLARQRGWQILLRIEDLDASRAKAGSDQQAIEDLRWLGIDWDEGPIYQAPRMAAYQGAIERLLEQGDAYYCTCSRKEIALAASAPHAEDRTTRYPGTCRGRFASKNDAKQTIGPREPAIRFQVPSQRIDFTDGFRGEQRFDMEALGDFPIAKGDGSPAYQLAVVVDDCAHKITDVVRSDDLLDSTPRQICVWRALGHAGAIPQYWHVPLVIGPDGHRLAKRHGDSRIAAYRDEGVSAGRVLALLARWCGMDHPKASTAHDLLGNFDLQRIPKEPIVFTDADQAFLLEGAVR